PTSAPAPSPSAPPIAAPAPGWPTAAPMMPPAAAPPRAPMPAPFSRVVSSPPAQPAPTMITVNNRAPAENRFQRFMACPPVPVGCDTVPRGEIFLIAPIGKISTRLDGGVFRARGAGDRARPDWRRSGAADRPGDFAGPGVDRRPARRRPG